MESRTKTVLITGCTGFTGVYLKEHLESKGFKVFGLSNSTQTSDTIFSCDLTQQEQVQAIVSQISPDYIIHLAAISFVQHPIIVDFYKVNVVGTQHLLQAASQLEKPVQKIILASSATVYGNQEGSEYHEGMLPNPVNHYGISKLAMEQVGKMYWEKLPILIVRPFNYTAPGQESYFVIPKIAQAFKTRAPQLELGNLDVFREYNSIRYVVEIYEKLLLSSAQSEVVNLCSGKMHALTEILQLFEKASGYSPKIEINPAFVRPNEIKYLCGSTQKLGTLISLPDNNHIEAIIHDFL